MDRELPYFAYTTHSRLDRSINSLLGVLEGIAIDGVINDRERSYLEAWIQDHAEVAQAHPFNELMPLLVGAISDGRLDQEERADLHWLCDRLRSREFYDQTTGDLQRLQGVLGGVSSDGRIEVEELRQLREWLDAHEHLRRCWPYDEVSALITGVLADGRIDPAEHELLLAFFSEFTGQSAGHEGGEGLTLVKPTVFGLCASCPEIEFAGMRFSFTGESTRFTREQLIETVTRLGGTVVSGVSGKVDCLIVGADGNPCWAFACYGRKIEKAMELRKAGARIALVHESDFHDAVEDRG